jgi:hypothetical protein
MGLVPKKPHELSSRRRRQLTERERRIFAVVLKNLRRMHGSWGNLGKVVGVPADTLQKISCDLAFPSMNIVMKVARAHGATVATVLSPLVLAADRCPTCGQRVQR